MFKCEKCGLDSAPGETQTKIVIATRKKEYPAFQRPNGTHDRGGIGVEIAREVTVHDQCAVEVQAMLLAIAPPTPTFQEAVIYADMEPSTSPFNGAHV